MQTGNRHLNSSKTPVPTTERTRAAQPGVDPAIRRLQDEEAAGKNEEQARRIPKQHGSDQRRKRKDEETAGRAPISSARAGRSTRRIHVAAAGSDAQSRRHVGGTSIWAGTASMQGRGNGGGKGGNCMGKIDGKLKEERWSWTERGDR